MSFLGFGYEKEGILVPFCTSVFFALANLSWADSQVPKKYLYLFGGNGVPIFDRPVEEWGSKALGANYMPTLRFSAQNGDTARNLVRNFKLPSSEALKPFSVETYNDVLGTFASECDPGIDEERKKYKPGEQVLFVLAAHGAYETDRGKKGHDIFCEGGLCSVSSLEPILSCLNFRGVKTALVDLSCFSGGDMRLSLPGTCLISMSSRDSIGLAPDGNQFLSGLDRGRSLEDSFLAAKVGGSGSSRINTTAGTKTDDALSQLTGSVRAAHLQAWEVELSRHGNLEELLPTSSVEDRLESFLKLLPQPLRGQMSDDPDLEKLVITVEEYEEDNEDAFAELKELIQLQRSIGDPKNPMEPCERIAFANEVQKRELSLARDVFTIEYDLWKNEFKSPVIRSALKVWRAEARVYEKVYRFFREQERQAGTRNACAEFQF